MSFFPRSYKKAIVGAAPTHRAMRLFPPCVLNVEKYFVLPASYIPIASEKKPYLRAAKPSEIPSLRGNPPDAYLPGAFHPYGGRWQ